MAARPADHQRDHGNLGLWASMSPPVGSQQKSHPHQGKVSAVPANHQQAVVLDAERPLRRPGRPLRNPAVHLILNLIQGGIDHLAILFHHQKIIQFPQSPIQFRPIFIRLPPAGQQGLSLCRPVCPPSGPPVSAKRRKPRGPPLRDRQQGQHGRQQGQGMKQKNPAFHAPSPLSSPVSLTERYKRLNQEL